MGYLMILTLMAICALATTTPTSPATALAENSGSGACKPAVCPPGSERDHLKYNPGHVYEYNFNSNMFVRHHVDNITLSVVGTAKVFAKDDCNYVLQLSSIKVSTSKDDADKKLLQNMQKPVQFSMSKTGKLEAELCVAETSENIYALNIKRAIISLLEHNDEKTAQVDVFGHCPRTITSVSNNGGNKIIIKRRNLDSCANYGVISSGFVTNAVKRKTGLRTTPNILDAKYYKEVKVQNGIVANVQATEDYTYEDEEPTATNENQKNNFVIKARVITKLKVKNPSGSPSPAPSTGFRRASIIFQQPDSYTAKTLSALKESLTKTIAQLDGSVKDGAAQDFLELIRLMRHADVDTLQQLAAFTLEHPKKDLARRVYLDALFRTATIDSTRATLKQISKMSDHEKKMAILSLNLVNVIDKKTLNDALILLTPHTFKEAYLGVGTLVSKYCNEKENVRAPYCQHSEEIKAISKKFVDSLKHCKATTKKEEDRLVYVLRGMANSEILSETVAPSLTECTMNGRPNRLRVNALKAFSVTPCETLLQTRALQLLKDINEDSEVRIEAFSALIKCPSVELANELEKIVNSEEINTVGNFMVSTLNVIRDSTDEAYANQRKHFANMSIKKTFVVDLRRFSHNGELSYDLKAAGVGMSAAYKVIYAQNGFLPRSSSVDLKAELFGMELDLLKTYVRMENMENVLEYLVGPKGIINKNAHFSDVLKSPNSGDNHHPRSRRSIADEAMRAATKYNMQKQGSDINLDIDVKIFGSELAFLSLGDYVPTTFDDMKLSKFFEEFKHSLSNYNKQIKSHDLLMDILITLPTSVGIPLELTVQTSTVSSVDLGVNVNVDTLMQGNVKDDQYKLKIEPSISVNMAVKLQFNAHVMSSGIHADFSAHSSTGSTMTFSMDPANGFDLNVQLPNEKLEFINMEMSYNLFYAKPDELTKFLITNEQVTSGEDKDDIKCYDELKDLGITPCISSNVKMFEQGNNQLIIPFRFSFYVIALPQFNIKGTFDIKNTFDNKGYAKCQLLYTSSDNKYDTSLTLQYGYEPLHGRVVLNNANFNYAYEVGFSNNDEELVFYTQYENDREVKAKNKIGYKKNGSKYRPLIEISDGAGGVTNEIFGYRVDGSVLVSSPTAESKRYDYKELQVIKANGDRWIIDGWVISTETSGTLLNSEVKLTTPNGVFIANGELKLSPDRDYRVALFVNDINKPDYIYGVSGDLELHEQNVKMGLITKYGKWELLANHEMFYPTPILQKLYVYNGFSNALTISYDKKNILASKAKGTTTKDGKKYSFDGNVLIDLQNLSKNKKKRKGSVSLQFSSEKSGTHDTKVDLTFNTKFNGKFVNLNLNINPENHLYRVHQELTSSFGTSITTNAVVTQNVLKCLKTSCSSILNEDFLIDMQCMGQFSNSLNKVLFKMSKEKTKTEMYLNVLEGTEDKQVVAVNSLYQNEHLDFNMDIRDTLKAHANMKLENHSGKTKADFSAEIIPQNIPNAESNKISIKGKCFMQKPKYDVDANVVYKDYNINIKSENNFDNKRRIYNTKTLIQNNKNEKISVDADVKCKTENEMNFKLYLLSPEHGSFETGFKRVMTTNPKTKVSQGNGELIVTVEGKDKIKHSLLVTSKLEKFEPKEKEFIGHWHVTYKEMENPKLILNGKMQNIIQDKLFNVHVNAQGPLIKDSNIVLDLNVEDCTWQKSNVNLQLTHNGAEGEQTLGKLHLKYNMPSENNVGEKGFYIVEMTADRQKPNQRPQNVKITSEGSYVKNPEKDASNTNFMVNVLADNTKVVDMNLDLASQYGKCSTKFILQSNHDLAKHIEFIAEREKIGENSVQWQLSLQQEPKERPYKLIAQLFMEDYKKGFSFETNYHVNEQPDRAVVVTFYYELLQNQAKVVTNIENLFEVHFKMDTYVNYLTDSLDGFYLESRLHTPTQYTAIIKGTEKALNVNVKKENNVILQGSLNYMSKQQNNKKYLLEGKGSLIFKQQEHQANFKIVKEMFDITNNNEVGFSINFNANVASRNAVANFKMTNKEFNVKLAICEEKKECTNVEVLASKEAKSDPSTSSTKSLLIFIDLRELGVPYELEVQSKHIMREGSSLGLLFNFEDNIDVKILGPNNHNYKLYFNGQPFYSKLQIVVPSREMLMELKNQYPQDGKIFGNYETSLTFYPNKVKQPDLMLELRFEGDITKENNLLRSKGVVKFVQATNQVKPLVASGILEVQRHPLYANVEVDLDVFKSPEYQIKIKSQIENVVSNQNNLNLTAQHSIKSDGFNFDYNLRNQIVLKKRNDPELTIGSELSDIKSALKSNVYLSVKPTEVEFLAYLLNERLLQAKSTLETQTSGANLDTQLSLGGSDTFNVNGEVRFGQHFKITANSNRADTRAEIFNVFLNLNSDDQHKKFSWNINDDEFKKLTESSLHQWQFHYENIKKKLFMPEALENNDLYNKLVQQIPDLTLLDGTLKDILKELQEDPVLRESLKRIEQLYKAVQDVLNGGYQRTKQIIKDLIHKTKDIVRDVLSPAAQEFLDKSFHLTKEFITELTSLSVKVLHIIEGLLKEFHGETLSDILKPLHNIAQNVYNFGMEIFTDLSKELSEYVQQLKSFQQFEEDFNAQYVYVVERLNLLENTVHVVDEIYKQLQLLPLNAEFVELFSKLHDFLTRKLKREPVNEHEYAEELLHLSQKALKSILIHWNLTDLNGLNAFNVHLNELLGVNSFLPSFAELYDVLKLSLFFTPAQNHFRFNLFNFIVNENWTQFFKQLRLILFYEGFALNGHIIDGRHFITFDGSYTSFTDNCKYLLAFDYVHNNFSIIAALNNGKLKSIYLIDRDGQFLEVTDTGSLKLNGKPIEFPLHENGMHSWRLYYTVWLYSEYGVGVMCTRDLKLCHIEVNGFYTGRLGGLLGNGNAEPFDDFTLMSGVLADTPTQFVNAYGLGKCQPNLLNAYASTNKNDNLPTHNSLCSDIFGYMSPLALGYIAKSPKTFQLACDYAASNLNTDKDLEDNSCTFAMAYASAVNKQLGYTALFLPPRCLKCPGSEGQRELFDTFTVKTPTNKADIVFVIDTDVTSVTLNNLVAPAITQIRDVLKTRGFSDVQIAVIVYSNNQLYPGIVTSDNGKLNYHGDIKNVYLNGPKVYFDDINLSEIANDKTLVSIGHFILTILKTIIPQADEKAFVLATNYPFRAQAAKSVIVVKHKTSDYHKMLPLLRVHFNTFQSVFLHVLTPIEDIHVDGSSRVIGFNNRVIATLDGKDAKKRQNLTYPHDLGIQFVLNSGGWIFNTNEFDSFKPQDQQKMLHQITNSIADTMLKTDVISDCYCQPIHGLHAQHKCYTTDSNFVPNKKVKS